MRLGQLTRQLNIGTTKVVNFLKDAGIEIEGHPNTKLSEDIVEKLFKKFPPQIVENEINKEVVKTIEDSSEEVIEVSNVEDLKDTSIVKEVIPNDTDLSVTTDKAEDVENVADKSESLSKELPKTIDTPSLTEKLQLEENPINTSKADEEIEIVTLPKEEVDKMVEAGDIVSNIEAEAATLNESEIIKAKFTTLEGLNVKGKIELPPDPRRKKKEEARKIQEEISKAQSNAGKTIDGVHPTKRAKEEGEKTKADLEKSEQEALKKMEQLRMKALREKEKSEKANKKNKPKKKKKKSKDKTLSPEELKKKVNREKRKKAKEKANIPAPSRNILQKIWDFIK